MKFQPVKDDRRAVVPELFVSPSKHLNLNRPASWASPEHWSTPTAAGPKTLSDHERTPTHGVVQQRGRWGKKVLDAAIIGSAQAVEHYEIARYGTLIAWAKELGHLNVVSLLNANLKEEKATDKKLIGLAEGGVNRRAIGRTVSRSSTRPAAAFQRL